MLMNLIVSIACTACLYRCEVNSQMDTTLFSVSIMVQRYYIYKDHSIRIYGIQLQSVKSCPVRETENYYTDPFAVAVMKDDNAKTCCNTHVQLFQKLS